MIARCFSLWLAAGLWLGVSLGAGQVRADEGPGLIKMGESDMSDNRARAHFKVGTSLYESGRFKEAAAEWESAYALSKRDALLYNIYVANRDASDLPKAIDALRRYLATDAVDPTQRLNLEARLRAMQGSVDAANEAKAADSTPPPSAAEPTTPAQPAPAAAPGNESSSSSSVLPVALVITGGALVAGGLVMGLVTNAKVSKIEDSCPKDLCPPSFELEDERSGARTFAGVTDLLLVSGALVTTVGVVLWLMNGEPSTEQAPSASMTPALACATTGCAASFTGSF